MAAYAIPRRGQVWMVALDTTVGHEVKKTRPAIVVTNDVYNANNWVVTVLPLTSRDTAQLSKCFAHIEEG